MPELRMYWYAGAPNFGDALSPAIVEFVTRRKVTWAPPDEARLFGLGSILDPAVRLPGARAAGADRVAVWGSGLMCPVYAACRTLPGLEFLALRGPLTAACLESDKVPKGDPGLLVRRMYPELRSARKKFRGGIVLHHTQQMSSDATAALGMRGWTIIPASDSDYAKVLEEIAACEVILSSSLHGLVVADALGVPNEWVDAGRMHVTQRFKFYDYANAIGRPLSEPLVLQKVQFGEIAEQAMRSDRRYWSRIDPVNHLLADALCSYL